MPMPAQTSKFAAAFGFSQLVEADDKDPDGKKAKRIEERKKKEGESDDEHAKRCAAMDEEEAKAAAESDEKKDGKKDDEKEAKARAAGFSAGVSAERARWSTVLASKQAEGRGITACSLLDTTDASAESVCATLLTIPQMAAAQPPGLAARMAAVAATIPAPAAGGATAPAAGSSAEMAAQIVAAANKARGEKV